MRRTIEELWSGNIAPCEKCGMHNQEIKELIRLIQRNRENSKMK